MYLLQSVVTALSASLCDGKPTSAIPVNVPDLWIKSILLD